MSDLSILESRIAELEARLRTIGNVDLGSVASFSEGSCTNNCTAACTIGCTSGCTGGCRANPGELTALPAATTQQLGSAQASLESFRRLSTR